MKRILNRLISCFGASLALVALLGLTAKSSAAQYEIIPTNQTWRYIVPTDAAFCLAQGTWETVGFDDSGWAGPSPGGFTGGETTAATVTTLAGWLNTSTLPAPTALGGRPYYFRTHFNLASTNSLNLYFTNRIDDQAVWYINGVRVFDLNHPTVPETCTPGGAGGGEATTNFVFMLTSNQLAGIVVVGDNVLAVSVHQNATGSSDMVFGTTLWGENVTADSPIIITANPTNQTVAERGLASFHVTATGTPQDYHWRSNGVAISGAPNAPTYSFSAPYSANGAVYSVIVSNSTGPVTSTGATLTVIPDTTAPTVVSVVGNPDLATVTITFSENILPSAVDPANFILWPTGGDPEVDYLLTTGAVQNNGTNVVITTDLRIAGTNYSLRILEVRDDSSLQNVIDPNPTDIQFITQTVALIDFDDNNVWKFGTLSNAVAGPTYNPTTEFSIPVGWETVGYDDSAWPEGPAGLGLDASVNGVPIRTPTGYAAHSEPTFFRRHFTLPALTNGLVLNIRHVFEDGAVVYINGVDTYRFNVAAATDANNPASRSAAAAVDPTPITGPISLSLSNVHAGDNTIAVVVIQSGGTSSDIELAVELTASIPQYPAGPIVINAQPVASTTVNEGSPFTLGVGASGAIPITYQWRKGGVPISGQTNSTYSVASAVPGNAGTYTVAVSNSFGGLISSSASVTVIPDSTAPVILSAIGTTNLNEVVVTLYDAGRGVDLATANNPANYNVHLRAGGPNLGIASVAAVNSGTNTVVTITTTAPRAASQNYTVTLTGVKDQSAAQNPVTPASADIAATVIIFPFAHVWRYEDTGADLGTAWRASGFNDSAWPSGAGILGVETTTATLTFFTNIAGGSGTNTVLSLTNNAGGGIATGTNFINVTIYFRTPVSITDFNPSAPGNTVYARSYIDDGAAVYVNGAESMRYNLTNTANYTNFAVANLAEGVLTVSNLTGFVQGANVIAAEVHQDSLGSSDIDWGMQLEAFVTTFGGGCPTLHISRNAVTGQITLSWTGSGTLQETTALLSPSASTVWNPSARVNGVPFTPGAARYYRLSCP